MNGMFRDRTEAGRLLAPKLREFAHQKDVLVLAPPRGGVVVGFEVAQKLRAPLDVLVVRKLGVPRSSEYVDYVGANGARRSIQSAWDGPGGGAAIQPITGVLPCGGHA